jgi:hypothetical protein
LATRSEIPRTTNTGAAILGRLLQPHKAGFSPEAARDILAMTFRPRDRRRVDALSAKAREGTLSAAERAELEEYLRVADLLAMLKAKARLSLRDDGAAR